MPEDTKPAVRIGLMAFVEVTAVERSVGWPTHWMTIDGVRYATATIGENVRMLVDGRVLQVDLVAFKAEIIRQLTCQVDQASFKMNVIQQHAGSDMNRPPPAEASVYLESEEDAE